MDLISNLRYAAAADDQSRPVLVEALSPFVLDGKTVVVAGARSDLMTAVAAALHQVGAKLVVAGTEGLDGDPTTESGLMDLARGAVRSGGRIDAWVCGPASSSELQLNCSVASRVMSTAKRGTIVLLSHDDGDATDATATVTAGLAHHGVRVNAVVSRPDAAHREVASAVLFLASDASQLMTGQVLRADGLRKE